MLLLRISRRVSDDHTRNRQYLYPLCIFGNFDCAVLRNASVKKMFNERSPAAIGSSSVIEPNVDAVYSRAVLELSSHDVVLTILEINDRYWVDAFDLRLFWKRDYHDRYRQQRHNWLLPHQTRIRFQRQASILQR
jgi:hypothetical protein